MKMHKSILIFIILLTIGTAFFYLTKGNSIQVFEKNGSKRPAQIMLFTCQYGSGHKMATQSIIENLSDCEVRVVDIYDEPLKSIDPMRSLAPALSNEHIYNDWIKKEKNDLLNLAGRIAPQFLLLQKNNIQELLTKYISKDKPDLIISCVPLVNSPLLAVADELNIPLLVITTDIDISAFCFGLSENLEENKSHFRITVPYPKAEWDKLFGSHFSQSLQNSFQYGFGYPTRQSFSKKPNSDHLKLMRNEYEIKKDENVILIMMGGNAGRASKAYANFLMQMDDDDLDQILGKGNPRDKIHLICLCGDISRPENKAFMDSLNTLNSSDSSSRVRIHGCPGTPKIGELVSLPELCMVISKPGGSTVNEMIKKKVPMIYHTKKHPLDWEKGNMEYGELKGLGKRFSTVKNPTSYDISAFRDLLAAMFALNQDIRSGKITVPEADIDFSSNLRQTVQDMIFDQS